MTIGTEDASLALGSRGGCLRLDDSVMGGCRPVGFLAVPSKKCSMTDWTAEIKRCLMELDEDVSGFEKEIQLLNKLRTDMQGAEANATGLGLIYRYYSQLESMNHRLAGLQKPKEVNFEW